MKITVLPHPELCPGGKTIEADAGTSIADALLSNGVAIEHACEKCGACSTCHVIVREGFDSLSEMDENEEDRLGFAWGLEQTSRLACRAKTGEEDITVEIPKYSLNHARELP